MQYFNDKKYMRQTSINLVEVCTLEGIIIISNNFRSRSFSGIHYLHYSSVEWNEKERRKLQRRQHIRRQFIGNKLRNLVLFSVALSFFLLFKPYCTHHINMLNLSQYMNIYKYKYNISSFSVSYMYTRIDTLTKRKGIHINRGTKQEKK